MLPVADVAALAGVLLPWNVRMSVTARSLPRRFRFDARDELFVIDEGFEEVVPFVSGAASMGEHLSQLVNPIVSESGECLVCAIVDADDTAIGEIVVVADDRLKEFRVLSKLFRDNAFTDENT